ncbi:DUF2781 domain-containing protein [Myxococcota bacterium]|nr:DUF2781 domain-containing protein [Myxococcota bacterium]
MHPAPLPLAARPWDVALAAALLSMAAGGAMFDTLVVFDLPIHPDAESPLGRAAYAYASRADPLLLLRPFWARVCLTASLFVFIPFYVVAAAALLRAWAWIQLPAVIVGSVVFGFTGVLMLGVELFGPPGERTPDPALWLAFNAPYALIPLWLIARMRRPDPFARRF